MFARASAMDVLFALISGVLMRLSGMGKKLPASEPNTPVFVAVSATFGCSSAASAFAIIFH
jgi:hypothetical protein